MSSSDSDSDSEAGPDPCSSATQITRFYFKRSSKSNTVSPEARGGARIKTTYWLKAGYKLEDGAECSSQKEDQSIGEQKIPDSEITPVDIPPAEFTIDDSGLEAENAQENLQLTSDILCEPEIFPDGRTVEEPLDILCEPEIFPDGGTVEEPLELPDGRPNFDRNTLTFRVRSFRTYLEPIPEETSEQLVSWWRGTLAPMDLPERLQPQFQAMRNGNSPFKRGKLIPNIKSMNECGVRPKNRQARAEEAEAAEEERRDDADSPDQNLDNDSDQPDAASLNDQLDQNKKSASSDGSKRVSPVLIEEREHKKTNTSGYKPTRKYPNRDMLLNRHRDLSQENKRLLGVPRNSSLAPLLRDGGSLGGILSDIPDYYTDEVTVQFLNAQVRSLKEELENLIRECVDKDEMVILLEQRLKDSEIERTKLQRETTNKDTHIEKLQKQLHEAKEKCDSVKKELSFINREFVRARKTFVQNEIEVKEMRQKLKRRDAEAKRCKLLTLRAHDALNQKVALCANLKKEADILKQGQRQAANVKSNLEAKLNRAVEENERLKNDGRQTKQANKEAGEHYQRKLEELVEKMRRLEKQNTELHEAMKKQMRLILNLKRQKLHVEAAAAVQFVEEEFMKALDRGT